jgi:sec-independent protein translocase protein TatA
MPNFSGWEWIVVLVIALLVFGVGRVGRIGGELGEAVSNFRKGLRAGNEETTAEQAATGEAEKPKA